MPKSTSETLTLETMMPNGKRLGECTRGELESIAKGFDLLAEICARAKPNQQMGEVVTLDEYRQLIELFYGNIDHADVT